MARGHHNSCGVAAETEAPFATEAAPTVNAAAKL